MGHNLFTFAVIGLLFSLIPSKSIENFLEIINEIKINTEKGFSILPFMNNLVVYTQVSEDGYISNRLTLPEDFNLKKEDVEIYLNNSTSTFDKSKIDEDLKKQMNFSRENSKIFIITFPIKKNYFAYTYFKRLPSGNVKVKSYYVTVTKKTSVFLIIVIIDGIILAFALIFWIIRKLLY